MAEFCSQCEEGYFDINLARLSLKLKRGYSTNFICEGCARRCIYKDEKGLLFVGYVLGEEIELQPARIEDL